MGCNGEGQLGDGTTIQRNVPVQILVGGVQAVAAGDGHSLIVRTDGSLWAMGLNAYGELGDGTTTQRDAPVLVLSGGVQAVAAGDLQTVAAGGRHTLFVKTDGSLWAMGDNTYGQFGGETRTQYDSPVQILAGGVQAVAAGAYHSLILETDGSLWAMGDNTYGQLGDGTTIQRSSPVQIFSGGVRTMAAGDWHTLILMTDGSLWATGANWWGQLGDGTTIQRNAPVQIVSGGVRAVTAGGALSLFIKTDGSLWAIGGTTDSNNAPVQLLSGGVQAAATRGTHSLILKTDGSLWGIGGNTFGQLGDGTTTPRDLPELIAVNVQKIAAGTCYSLIVTGADPDVPQITVQPKDAIVATGQSVTLSVVASGLGTLTYQWRRNGVVIEGATAASYTIDSFGADQAGSYDVVISAGMSVTTSRSAQLVAAQTSIIPANLEVGEETVPYQILVSSNVDWTATADADWVMLSKASGSREGNILVTAARNSTGADRVATIRVNGALHTLTQRAAGAPLQELWACGSDFYGQLGDNRLLQHLIPSEVAAEIGAIAAGSSHSLMVKTDGSLWAMGSNTFGQLGDGTTTQRNSPVEILSGGVRAAAAGARHSLIVRTDSSLWAMGFNTYGELGDGTTVQRISPVQILSDGVQAVAAGGLHSLILKTDGSLWAMGANGYGQLGDGTTTQRNSPVQILSGGVQAVAAGDNHSLILKTDGSLWAMGMNTYGQLGDGTTVQRNSPVQILSNGVQAVAAGGNHSLIVKTDGSLWAMGMNTNGELGDATTANRPSPVLVLSGGVQAVAAGFYHSLILKTDGSLWAMGDNSSGQLGDGTTTQRNTPELIAVNVQKFAAGGLHSLLVATGDISLFAPTFTTQPANQAAATGGTASFTAAASGVPTPALQWQASTDAGRTWANLADASPYSGTATGTLGITDATVAMNGGQYRCVATNGVGSATSEVAVLAVVKSDQTISFGALPGRTYGDAGFNVSASTTSGLPVSFFVISGPATIAGSTVTLTGAGTVTIRASQAGDANYNAAPSVDRSFTVAKATQRIRFPAIGHKTYGDAVFNLRATASSGLLVTYSVISGPATIAGSTLTLTGAGTVTIRASQAGDANYNAAPSVDRSFTVAKAAQKTSFPSIGRRTYGDAAFDLSASASSGLPVTYIVISGPATTAGRTVTLTGAGTVTIRASQAGDANYKAAASVNRSFTIAKARLTAKADDKTKVRGTANPVLTITYTGFVYGETAAVLDSLPTASTTARTGSPAGTYPITLSGGSDSNYAITLQKGALTVTR